jgi:hypothetical protein
MQSNIMINDVMHDSLNKLRIISKLREGQKLDTYNGLAIYNDGWISWLMRKWNRDSKDEGMRFLRDLYKSFHQTVEVVIVDYRNSVIRNGSDKNDSAKNGSDKNGSDKNSSDKNGIDEKRDAVGYVLVAAAIELRNSIKGLDSLYKTYKLYPTISAELDGIVRDYIIVTYTSLLNILPKEKIAKELLEPIVFAGTQVYR